MGRKWVGRITIDSVQPCIKTCFHAPVHLIISGIRKSLQRKADGGEHAEAALSFPCIAKPDRPDFMQPLHWYKNSPRRLYPTFLRFNFGIPYVMGTSVSLNLFI